MTTPDPTSPTYVIATLASDDGRAEDWQAQSSEHTFRLEEVIRICEDEGWSATLTDAPGFRRGWVKPDGSWSLA